MHELVWVRGHQVVRSLYEQRPIEYTLTLVEDADHRPGHAAAESLPELACGKAQALALAGRREEAITALHVAEEIFTRLPDSLTRLQSRESDLRWTENRMRFAQSVMYSNLGLESDANDAQVAALGLYTPEFRRGPAQIRLHQSLCLATIGDAPGGTTLVALRTMQELPADDLVRPIIDAGYAVLRAVPPAQRAQPAYVDLRDYLATLPALV